MKLLQKIMGRRQFLVAAGLTSALGLGVKKLTEVFNSGIETGVALASESTDAFDEKGGYFRMMG